MFNEPPPNPKPAIHIFKKEIKLRTCQHLNKNNVEEDMIVYKFVNALGRKEFFGTCSLCYLEKISFPLGEKGKKGDDD
jgi:hypothetical protein